MKAQSANALGTGDKDRGGYLFNPVDDRQEGCNG
jgi:hypothetical protein